MRSRRPWLILVFVLVPTVARANDHVADLLFAASLGGGSVLRGGRAAITWTMPKPTTRDVALFLDLSVLDGEHDDNDVTKVGYLFGIRWTPAGENQKHLPTFHALVGDMKHNSGPEKGNHWAFAFGGGYEIVPVATRTVSEWAFRTDADVIVVNDASSFVRASAGVVWRWHPPQKGKAP